MLILVLCKDGYEDKDQKYWVQKLGFSEDKLLWPAASDRETRKLVPFVRCNSLVIRIDRDGGPDGERELIEPGALTQHLPVCLVGTVQHNSSSASARIPGDSVYCLDNTIMIHDDDCYRLAVQYWVVCCSVRFAGDEGPHSKCTPPGKVRNIHRLDSVTADHFTKYSKLGKSLQNW